MASNSGTPVQRFLALREPNPVAESAGDAHPEQHRHILQGLQSAAPLITIYRRSRPFVKDIGRFNFVERHFSKMLTVHSSVGLTRCVIYCSHLGFSCSARNGQLAHRNLCQSRHSRVARNIRTCAARKVLWEQQWRVLVENDLQSVRPEVAKQMVDSGDWVLVDVRPAGKYEEAHPEGAISVPTFQKVDFTKPSFGRYLRAAALLANGIEPVEPNESFLEELKQAAGGKGVILACETGGTLTPLPNFGTGKVSRSLKAAFDTLDSKTLPAEKIGHLVGGVYAWAEEGLPFTGEYNSAGAGRTPNIVNLKD